MPQHRKSTDTAAHDRAMPVVTLAELCSEAADHVAKARLSLFDESTDAAPALLHLDEAIFCLKRLLAHGRASNFNGGQASLGLRICEPERRLGLRQSSALPERRDYARQAPSHRRCR